MPARPHRSLPSEVCRERSQATQYRASGGDLLNWWRRRYRSRLGCCDWRALCFGLGFAHCPRNTGKQLKELQWRFAWLQTSLPVFSAQSTQISAQFDRCKTTHSLRLDHRMLSDVVTREKLGNEPLGGSQQLSNLRSRRIWPQSVMRTVARHHCSLTSKSARSDNNVAIALKNQDTQMHFPVEIGYE